MSTIAKLGPADHGRPMSLDEFLAGDYKEGCQYELIDGKLYVSPQPDPPENLVEVWIFGKFLAYSRERLDIVNYVTNKARVVVPGRRRTTTPEPDLAAYRDFPLDRPFRQIRWSDVSPFLVGEVLCLGDPLKDLERNVDLYLRVPSIREYWLFDTRENPEQPTLIVHRRHGSRWRVIEVGFGETYTTRLLPGFGLLVDPRQ